MPARDYFTLGINVESATYLSVDLYDLAGRLVETLYQQPLSQGKHALEFTTEYLASGNYLLRIKDGKTVYLKKLLINK
ncbi:hypothetical protein SDC9_147575 [bioreactor metagenome]|uniref:Secretion system C-terminal sorting domain-containing protein n=1 Tax=bioreactor metagenome TaxID=1076179 RepID=A0A645EEQ6_9ZZZZ